MKQCLLGAICLLFSTIVFANTAEEAAAAYALRDYDAAGIQSAQKAVELYAQAISSESDETTKLNLMLDLSSAHYFLGTALDNKDDRKAEHQKAMDMADQVMSAFGVSADKAAQLSDAEITELLNKLDEQQEFILADAMYFKGINLAQWGNLNGIASSIGKLPSVLGLMERVEKLGYEYIHDYGPYRTIGRINYKLPGILGGDLKKSEKYLQDAYRKTLVPGQRYSINGFNNIYLAETLYKQGKETQAKKLLDIFLKADPTTLHADSEPENKEAFRLAKELADSWK